MTIIILYQELFQVGVHIIMSDFIFNAILAGMGVALIAGVLGCFVVWRRMAYFGDSLSHAALLGIAFGLATGIQLTIGTMLVCAGFAVLLLWLQSQKVLATDTLLGILAHAGLSIGMVTLSLVNAQSFDIHSYLFGDILTIASDELYWLYGGGALVMLLLWKYWHPLLLITLNEDLAKAEGVPVAKMNFLMMFLMTVTVAVSVRFVGVLLITSLLIIPAATARQLVRSPVMMAVAAALIGMGAVLAGVAGSYYWDTPSGPTIVSAAVGLFAVLFPVGALIRRPF